MHFNSAKRRNHVPHVKSDRSPMVFICLAIFVFFSVISITCIFHSHIINIHFLTGQFANISVITGTNEPVTLIIQIRASSHDYFLHLFVSYLHNYFSGFILLATNFLLSKGYSFFISLWRHIIFKGFSWPPLLNHPAQFIYITSSCSKLLFVPDVQIVAKC